MVKRFCILKVGVCIGYIVKFGICGDCVQDFRVERVISIYISFSYNNPFVKLIINLVVQLLEFSFLTFKNHQDPFEGYLMVLALLVMLRQSTSPFHSTLFR